MRVLLITQLFDPENAIKGLSFCDALQKKGHEIEVLTTFPSYPGGRLYPGFRMRVRQVELLHGVRVVRLPSYISHGRSAVKRLLSYASFSAITFFYALFVKRPDLVYCYYPPMLGGIAGVLIKKLRGARLVYDVQDLWPEAVAVTGMLRSGLLIRLLDGLISFVYRNSDAIVTLSDGYRKAIAAKGVPEGKIHRVYNWCDETRISRTDSVKGGNEFFDILYAGNIGAAQALGAVIEAAAILQRSGDLHIRFIFLGDGVEKPMLLEMAQVAGLHNVIFKDWVPPEQVSEYLARASALLVHLASNPVFDITVPQKTQAYLAAGKPLLMAVGGESGAIVRNSRAGLVARPCDSEDIASKALCLSFKTESELEDYGRNGMSFYRDSMSLAHGVNQISQLILALCGGDSEAAANA